MPWPVGRRPPPGISAAAASSGKCTTNPTSSFGSRSPNVNQYARLALEVGRALRAAEPGETYVGPATSTIDFAFLEKCFQAGLLEYWSAVTVHPYRQEGPETAAAEYARLRQLIARYAPAGKKVPIISGEWGYSSAWNKYDEARQGKMLPRQWLVDLEQGVPLSIWYDWHDDGQDAKEPEHHFGTVHFAYDAARRPVYEPKPAYTAAATLTGILAGFRFEKHSRSGRATITYMSSSRAANGDMPPGRPPNRTPCRSPLAPNDASPGGIWGRHCRLTPTVAARKSRSAMRRSICCRPGTRNECVIIDRRSCFKTLF